MDLNCWRHWNMSTVHRRRPAAPRQGKGDLMNANIRTQRSSMDSARSIAT